ncbi:MAG TPA: pseudouridine synthase [Gemmatimonadaceae bacterium]|nr:pseudouridine synthase [Gemmatimonadaceae bacterium]
MRLQRALARAGIASRRKAEELITAGRVTVNGRVATLGESADPASDDIRVDGKRVAHPVETVWIALHKPPGVMTTRAEPRGRPTVFDYVHDSPGLTYVGRLDFLTEGLLLLTNDGDAVHALMHPSNEVERSYVAVVRGDAPAAAVKARKGVELDDGMVKPTRVSVRDSGDGRYEFELTITEGRKREVRRLCKALGLRVDRLIRVRYGPVSLGALPVGKTRPLTADERHKIQRIVELSTSAGGPIFEGS